jgi:hypothetical protein
MNTTFSNPIITRFIKQPIILTVLLLVCFSGALKAQNVFVTNTSQKFHLEGCAQLDKKSKSISLTEAKAKKLEPCKLCNRLPESSAPSNGMNLFYVSKNGGDHYHNKGCSELKGTGDGIEAKDAVHKKLRPCDKCKPPSI